MPTEESKLWGVTIRGWLAVTLVVTVCAQSLLKIDVKEPMYTLVIMAVSFYLGSKSSTMNTKSNTPNITTEDIKP